MSEKCFGCGKIGHFVNKCPEKRLISYYMPQLPDLSPQATPYLPDMDIWFDEEWTLMRSVILGDTKNPETLEVQEWYVPTRVAKTAGAVAINSFVNSSITYRIVKTVGSMALNAIENYVGCIWCGRTGHTSSNCTETTHRFGGKI